MKNLKEIISKASENDTQDVKRFLFGSIELTSLKCTDSEQSIMSFVDRVNKWDDERPYLPHPATICVYPCYAEVVKEYLQVEGIGIACVSGSFPSSQEGCLWTRCSFEGYPGNRMSEDRRKHPKGIIYSNECRS